MAKFPSKGVCWSIPRNSKVEHYKLVLNDNAHIPENTSQGILLKSKAKTEYDVCKC